MSINGGKTAIEIPARAQAPDLGQRPARLAPEVLGQVGETFAAALSDLHRSLSTFGSTPELRQDLLDAARAEIARLEFLGVRIQEIARVLGGEVPLPSERMELLHAVRETLDSGSPAARSAGVAIAGPEEPCEVEVNAAVLEQLLSLGLEYALQTGPTVAIGAGRQGQPARATLTIRVERPAGAGAGGATEDFGDLRWTLFVLLARAVGLSPQRLAVGRVVTVMLGFPETTDALAADAVLHAEGLQRTAATTGRRVLLIEPQEFARVAAYDLMRHAGMEVDSAASVQQAREGLQDGAPDVIVTGIAVDDDAVATLLEEIRGVQPRLRVIELVDDANAFAFSVPGSDRPAEVGRSTLSRTLVAAVAQELDAA